MSCLYLLCDLCVGARRRSQARLAAGPVACVMRSTRRICFAAFELSAVIVSIVPIAAMVVAVIPIVVIAIPVVVTVAVPLALLIAACCATVVSVVLPAGLTRVVARVSACVR